MKIRKFIGKNFQDAFSRMKEELGENAIILNSRKLPRPAKGPDGAVGNYEVTAALDEKILSAPSPAIRDTALSAYGKNQDTRKQPREHNNKAPQPVRDTSKERKQDRQTEFLTQLQRFSQLESLKEEMNTLKSTMDSMFEFIKESRMPALPEKLKDIYKRMVNMEVQENLAKTIVQTILAQLAAEDIQNNDVLGNMLRKIFASIVKIAPPVERVKSRKRYVVSLVGPTGVGKTTTIAKIAANAKITEDKRVGIITADTFRIAAVEQIQTFANIAAIPLEVVYSSDDMKHALKDMSDLDLVLIDTVGRSQKKSEQLKEIKQFLDVAEPHEVHLVLSLTASTRNLMDVYDKFSTLQPNRLIFTKLDEVSGAGNLLNLSYKSKLPTSYITTGQNVPDDILLPNIDSLSRLLLYGLN